MIHNSDKPIHDSFSWLKNNGLCNLHYVCYQFWHSIFWFCFFKASLAGWNYDWDGPSGLCWCEPQMHSWFQHGKVHFMLILFSLSLSLSLSLTLVWCFRIMERRYLYVFELMTLRVSGNTRALRKLFCMNL